MFWSKVPGQAPLPQLRVAQQREVSHVYFLKLAQQYSALQEEECLHVQPINTPLEYCRHVTYDVFWLKVKRRSEKSKPRFHIGIPCGDLSSTILPSFCLAWSIGLVIHPVPCEHRSGTLLKLKGSR